MSGIWVFENNGVMRLVENPEHGTGFVTGRKKALVHLATGKVVTSYAMLEKILKGLGWENFYGNDPGLIQYHKKGSIDLISLPKDFSKFNSIYMYDVVIKNPNVFHVHDI